METATVWEIIRKGDGTVWQGAKVKAQLQASGVTSEALYPQSTVEDTSNYQGRVELTLFVDTLSDTPTYWQITEPDGSWYTISIPSTGTFRLTTLRLTTAPPATPQYESVLKSFFRNANALTLAGNMSLTSPHYLQFISPSAGGFVLSVSEPHLFVNNTLFFYTLNDGTSTLQVPPGRNAVTAFVNGVLQARLL